MPTIPFGRASVHLDATIFQDSYLKDYAGSIRPYVASYFRPRPDLRGARAAAASAYRAHLAGTAQYLGASEAQVKAASPGLAEFLNDVSTAVRES
jgi:hypothetical protein